MIRVLVFTDDHHFAEDAERALRRHRHRVHVSHLSPAEMEPARDFGADVILLDADANGGSLSLRQRLLVDRELARVPVVAVTSDSAQALLLSAQAMMSKPVEPVLLERLVERLASHVVM